MNASINQSDLHEDGAVRLLRRVGRECFGILDRETLLGRIVHLVSEYVGSPRVGIGLREGTTLRFVACSLGCIEDLQLVMPTTMPLDAPSLCAWAIQQRQAVLVTDVANDARYSSVAAFHDTVAELVLLIPSNNHHIQGVIDIQTTNPQHTLAHDQAVLDVVAQQLGLSLDTMAWYATTRRRSLYAEVIESIQADAEHQLDNEMLFTTIVNTISSRTLFRSVGLYTPKHHQLHLRAASPRFTAPSERPTPAHMRFPPTASHMDHQIIQTRLPTSQVTLDVALLAGTSLLGVLVLEATMPLDSSEIDGLIEFGHHIGHIIERQRLFRAMYVANERSTLFARIVSMIRQSIHVVELLDDVATMLAQGLNVDFCTVALLEKQTTLRLHGTYHAAISPEHQTATDTLIQSELLIALREHKHCIINSMNQDTQLNPVTRTAFQSLHVQALVWIPLQVNGQWLGVVCIYKLHQPYRWLLDELRLLTDVADQLALALRQMNLYEAERQGRRELEALQEIIRSISGELSLTALCQNVAQKLIDVFTISAAAISMWNPSHDAMQTIASVGFSPRYLPHLALNENVIQHWSARFPPPQPVYIEDIRFDAVMGGDAAFAEGLTSLLAQPLMVNGIFAGWLHMYSRGGTREWSQNELHLVASIGQQIAQAIYAARRYESEHLLRTDAEQSYQELRDVLTELEQTRERLLQSEKLRALGELASGVAHDFNNLLASILGNTQLLLLDEAADDRREALHMIERAAKDGAVTVRRIQEFARSEETVYNDVVDLSEVVKVGLEFTRPSWRDRTQQRGITLDIVTQLKSVYVLGSAAELREVFVNLLVNAVDALPNGGTITVATGIKNDWVYFSVADTGTGIAAENRARVFDPFFTAKPIGEGIGMGLAVALSIIQRHRGTLHLDNVKPHGARFIAVMPRHQPVVSTPIVVVEAKATAQTILVVDDEVSIRQMVARVLRHDNHTVVVVESGDEAITLLKDQAFDVIISDLGMPGMNGWDLLAQARTLHPQIVTVLMTGWGFQFENDAGQSRGVDLVLPKPFEVQALRNAIADLSTPLYGRTSPAIADE